MSLHEDLYIYYRDWYAELEQIAYIPLPSDRKIIANLIKLLASAMEAKHGRKATSAEVMEAWKVILSNWDRLEPFYRNRNQLKNILTDFNIILKQIKNGQKTKSTAPKSGGFSDEDLRDIARDIRGR